MAEKYGLLIDYTWCTGCHSCEIACKVEMPRTWIYEPEQ